MFLERSVFQVDDLDKFESRFSGQNQKNCLVIVPTAGFNEENHAFLTKIFSAVQFDLENDITLYTWDQADNASLMQIMARFPFSTCILFGVSPLILGLKMQIEPWKIIQLTTFSLLYCEPLSKIASDQTMKKNLWENLKILWK